MKESAATAPVDSRIVLDSFTGLTLATRRIDPDTLFFQRKLLIEGDTELGLQAKNVLDTVDPGQWPAGLKILLTGYCNFLERNRAIN